MCAISGTSGSSGLGSVSNEHIDSSTCIVHCATSDTTVTKKILHSTVKRPHVLLRHTIILV